MAYETGIGAHQLTFGSLFKVFFWANLAAWVILGSLLSISALFGAGTVSWNGAPVYGLSGLLIGLAISGIMGIIMSLITGLLMALVVKLFGVFMPIKKLRSTKQGFSNVATVFAEDS